MAKKKSLKQRTQKLRLTKQYKGGYKGNDGTLYTDAEGEKLLDAGEAIRASWKGGKKNKPSYEGGQYTGGRVKGRKNLKRTEAGNFINEHGVEFTPSERKLLEREVNKANRNRMKMIEQEGELPLNVAGKPTGHKVSSLQVMGKESDFIISRKSKSLQKFKSREQFESYLENLKIVNSPTYLDDRTRLYKRNHMKALENVFGDEAKDVIMKIRMMKPADYRKLIQSDEMVEINYIYDPSALAGKLNQIRASLGMQPKEEDMEEYEE